jgi:argininosuccinate lyase
VREKGLAFRTAYEIVANVVRHAVERGMHPADVSSAMIDEAAMEVIGRPIRLPEELVRGAMDPASNAASKQTTGGPSPKEVERMIGVRELELRAEREVLQATSASVESSRTTLSAAVTALIRSA